MYRECGDPYTDTRRVDDPECPCSHPVSCHDGPAGECSGRVPCGMRDCTYPYPHGGPARVPHTVACRCRAYHGSAD
jgi:hypothetical protein